MRFSTRFAGALGLFFECAGLMAQTPAAARVVMQANADSQPATAIDQAGNFVIVWRRDVAPADSTLVGQRFDVSRAALGEAFQIESSPPNSGSERFPSMAMDGSDNFVVAWEQGDQDDLGISGRLFDATGVAQGPQFQINSYSTSQQSFPSVARNAAGDFVVAWQSDQDGDGWGIYARRYDTAGVPQGPEFRVNTYTTGAQTRPSVAMNADGAFVVVWESAGQDGSDYGVFGQRFDSAGALLGSEFQVSTYTSGPQQAPRVAMSSSGEFVVVWSGVGHHHGPWSQVFGRRYDSAGVARAGEFLVSTTTSRIQTEPDVASNGAGDFVVSWNGGGSGQRFDAAGRRVGSEFRAGYEVPAFILDDHDRISYSFVTYASGNVSMNGAGNFVIVQAAKHTVRSRYSPRLEQINYKNHAFRGEFRAAGVMRVDEPAVPTAAARPESVAANRVVEPGETVTIAPTWTNTLQKGMLATTGTASTLTLPGVVSPGTDDATADYGSIAQSATVNCEGATGNCYQVTIPATPPRGAWHWDASFKESLSVGISKTWRLHIGETFEDVPTSQPFYRAIESAVHGGLMTGCTTTTYCPGAPVTRSEMSLFLARGVAGGSFAIPTSGFVGSNAYNCVGGGTSLFADIVPEGAFCRSIHYLASQNVTSGCSAAAYCPLRNVTRLEMSALVAKAVVAPGGGAAVPLTYGPDPVTKRSYSCDPASPSIHFTDVPASSPFCKHAHFLWAKGIVSGCGPTSYCPNDLVLRDAMARFLTNGFNVQLYGP